RALRAILKRRIVDALCICDKPGAFDCITKPIDLGGLRAGVGQTLRVSERRPEAETRLIGDSGVMRAIRATITSASSIRCR
ncbi:MAG: hypothetical protein ACREYC_15570, partial [Gammaproteobacteria bacterium]